MYLKRLINIYQSVINTVYYTNARWLFASLMCALFSTHRIVEAKMIFIGKAAAAARGVIITAMITHRLLKNTWNVHSLRGQAAALQPSISHLQSIIIISSVVVDVATAKRTLAAKYTGNLLLFFCMHLQNSSRCRDYSSMRTFRVWLETPSTTAGHRSVNNKKAIFSLFLYKLIELKMRQLRWDEEISLEWSKKRQKR